MEIRTYTELIQIPTYKGRFDYLAGIGQNAVGDRTFGGYRYLNQRFYASQQWRRLRDQITVRDNGMDMAFPGFPVLGRAIVHHMNPVTVEMIKNNDPLVWDPEYLVLVSEITHDALHYGNFDLIPKDYVPRRPFDTCPWRQPQA